MALSFFVYGSAVFNYTPSIDGEFLDNFRQTIALGRWGHALLHLWILPEPYSPFFSLLLSVMIIGASTFLLSIMLGGNHLNVIFYACLLLSVPQLAYQIQFANQADTVAIGMLSSVSAIYILDKWNEKTSKNYLLLVSAFLLLISLSIYQTYITYAFSIALSCLLRNLILSKHNSKQILKLGSAYALVFIVAMVLYFALQKFIGSYFDIPDRSSEYAKHVTHWGKRSDEAIIKTIYDFIGNSFFGGLSYGLNSFCLIMIPAAWLIVSSLKEGFKNFLWSALLVLALLISPFILLIYFGSVQYPRTMFALPIVFATITSLAFHSIKSNLFKCVISAILLTLSASSVSTLFYSDAVIRQHDYILMSKIYNDISENYPSIINKNKKKVFFYGSVENKSPWVQKNSDTFGASFFSWDGGNNLRIRALFDYYGLARFNTAQKSEVISFEDEIKKMNVFPSHGYIKEINGIIIIRLGDKIGLR